jgi:AbrB family looped-hinge helix DNA binding protein
MTIHTKISTKGQVVIPKDVRDHFNWGAHTKLEIRKTQRGIFLEPAEPPRRRITLEEFHAQVPPHDGPYIPESEWQALIDEDIRKRWAENGC